eukprot:g25563.t1
MKTEIAKAWPGGRYDLIHCNCIHFCDELSKRLGARAVPSWVRSLHETGAAAASVFRTFSQLNFLNLTTAGNGTMECQYELQLLAAGCKVEDSQSLGKLVDEYGQQSLRLNLRRVPVAAVEEASSASTKHAAASLIAE